MTGEQKDPKVVVGIIDDGIAFAHERFRSGDKTRIEYVWLQDGVYRPGTNVQYGREITKREIDDQLGDCTRAGVVDEDAVYMRTGLFDFRRPGHKAATWRTAHGTHVMDLACGRDPSETCDEVPIVCVQLPARATANTSGTDLTTYAIDALLYIRDRADEIGSRRNERLPVVVNFSYGIIGGPHDGTSTLEWFIDLLVAERQQYGVPFAVVLPAGNSHLSRCHAEVAFPSMPEPGVAPGAHDANVERLRWRVLPDDKTPSFLDIWMPPRAEGQEGDRVTVSVTPPGGEESPSLGDARNGILKWQPHGQTLCTLQHYIFPAPTGRSRFRITLRPTAQDRRGAARAPCGTWIVTIRNQGLGTAKAHAWIQRDESLYGYPRRGRQSYFDDPRYKRFDHAGRLKETDDGERPVKREGLINAMATGRSSIVVGGFLRKEGPAAEYSAGGPTIRPVGAGQDNRKGPDAMAVSDESRVHRGVLAAGARSGSVVAMAGTSVATPQITRWIANRLKHRQTAKRDAVEQEAAVQENRRPPNDPTRPSEERGGAGRINIDPIVPLPRENEPTVEEVPGGA